MKDRIKELLMTDEISYLSHLKMIDLYGENTVYNLKENSGNWAMTFFFPVCLSSFDAASYPDAKYIVYAAGNDKDLLRVIAGELPADCHLVFKTAKTIEKEIICELYSPVFIKSFLVFSANNFIINNPVNNECADVVSSFAMDESLLPLWLENGYDRDTIEKYFNSGAVSFSVFSGKLPLSTCIIFPATKNVWEIGAVHTMEAYRRQGFAKQVVTAAVNHILGMGKKPDYMAGNTNTSSIHLAQSLGLQKILEIEHLYF
ncbi:MAG: GNAT family N-acetyltransferase [Treponema sp.]|nr:GNAT family N-acetyltransferase [Treponema sp.]